MEGSTAGRVHTFNRITFKVVIVAIFLGLVSGCAQPNGTLLVGRETMIPAGAVKMMPDSDPNPPLVNSSEYEAPVQVLGEVNTAGGEDFGLHYTGWEYPLLLFYTRYPYPG